MGRISRSTCPERSTELVACTATNGSVEVKCCRRVEQFEFVDVGGVVFATIGFICVDLWQSVFDFFMGHRYFGTSFGRSTSLQDFHRDELLI